MGIRAAENPESYRDIFGGIVTVAIVLPLYKSLMFGDGMLGGWTRRYQGLGAPENGRRSPLPANAAIAYACALGLSQRQTKILQCLILGDPERETAVFLRLSPCPTPTCRLLGSACR
jgi:hypothetical protein